VAAVGARLVDSFPSRRRRTHQSASARHAPRRAPSTLSAAIARLESLGYITSTASADDKRRRDLTLTERGDEAMAATSVLDRDRVRAVLATLSTEDRVAAVRGLSVLARAARSLREES
jgi:DNA-binding MarR family transcriptional regulator